VNLNDTLSKIGGQKGQAGGMDAIVRLFGCSDMQGMMSALQSKGLGRQVKSWISTGQNQQVTAADIKKAADPAALRTMAKEQEMSPDELCDHVARALPHLVDQATPEGMVPQQGMGAMKSGMGAGAMKDGAMKDGAMKDGAMKDGAMKDGAAKGMGNMKSMPRK
jgi:uncharacterized protein YidB (DUF937 family)